MIRYTEVPLTGQKYFLKGGSPKILIVSGTHGDEFEVVPIVEETVERYLETLPDFLYVPCLSPSAVSSKNRKNKNGVDLNRGFLGPNSDPEVLEMMKLWSQFNFDTFYTFHEDPTQDKFYLYDGMKEEYQTKYNLEKSEQFKLLQEDLIQSGVELYSGIDDPDDPKLGYEVREGYARWPMITNDHSSDYWLLVETGLAKHVVNPETPGLMSIEKKNAIVDAVFRRLILKINS